ncbi:PTS sugar transporter subunit IIA [Alkalihalobacillus trypoxylicola]|uniref:Mannitol-specific phosphotransferase enzyme IIA component n=1 Tax=Alkalihalobacillus trypoxylicola TaxID=519424 RepID=A0A161PLB7_9BACI|nr:PTS sugar transporter subunit IIA [Alkalihalobacillus trypoxylicola]KYG34387.1 PTS mannitol transporter subunit IIA [Alkalihalobacillus trypoxylicola]
MKEILAVENIQLNGEAKSQKEAIIEVGNLLYENGYVKKDYVDKMLEREKITSTYMGNMLAIPHGTDDAKNEVLASGLTVKTYKEPVDWNGEQVRLVIGIAGIGNEHLEILSQIAIICSEEENVEKIVQATDPNEIIKMFSEVNEDE